MIDASPFRHLGLKLMAVALAALLWLIVAGDHLVERSLRVPLEFRNIPPELELVGDPPTEVDVRLRGSSALLGRLEPRDIVAVLDLASARPGSRMFHLRSDEVRAPYGVEVAQVVPGTLAVDLEKSGRRTVPVVPALDGEPAPGLRDRPGNLRSADGRGGRARKPSEAVDGCDDGTGSGDRQPHARPRRGHGRA